MRIQFKNLLSLISFISCLLFLGMQSVLAQTPHLSFKHLSVEDGLSQSTVRKIFQDKMGFMWFGTDMGLNKYDGSGFTYYQYNAGDTLGIASNYIVELFEDSKGVFWIGNGYSGLNRFDREHEIFYKYVYNPKEKSSISSNNIRAIFEDSKKNLWIGTIGGGLNLYDRHSDSFIHFYHDSLSSSGIGSNNIISIAEDKKGFLWFSSGDGILTRFDMKTKQGQSFRMFNNYKGDINNPNFNNLYIDSDDNIWIGTEIGLYYYDQKKGIFQHFVKGNTNKNLNESAVTSILEMQSGVFLIATDHGGLNIFNKKTGTFTYCRHSSLDPSSLSNDQIYTMYHSKDGIIWIGNYHGGVNILDTKTIKFQQYNDLFTAAESFNSHNSVLAICEDRDKNIWIGYDGQGIDILNTKTRKIEHLQTELTNPAANSIKSVVEIYKDRNDDIWIGTYQTGMYKYDWRTKHFTHYQYIPGNLNGLGGNNVWCFLEDNDGILWIGVMGTGLDRFDRKTNKFSHYINDPKDTLSLSNNDIFKVFQDNSGEIWVGTRNGLNLLNKNSKHFTRFMSGKDPINGIFGTAVYDIFQDNTNNLWIGTDQALNLYMPKSKSFKHFQQKEGSSAYEMLCITNDKHNNLWISSNKGVSRFNINKRTFRNFDIADGLQSNEFNYTSALNSSDGRIYFGGRNGVNVFYPDSIKDNPGIPAVYFTKISLANTSIGPRNNKDILSKHINFEKIITLNHEQSVITFEFAALNYSNPLKNRYAYWLEGFDNNWNYSGSKHEVTYTNLNPGKYLLKVKGSNNDGIWNETGASIQLIILPPWWKTWWFKFLFYLSLGGLMLLIYYLRIAFYRNQQEKLMLLVKERTLQLEEVAVTLESKQEEINSQNEELMAQRDEILLKNSELDKHQNKLEILVEDRTNELVRAKNKAEESDRLKSSFLANLSHEIRTPLNAILGFSALLSEKERNEKERQEYNKIIRNNSHTLLELINDILDISKIEAGQVELDLKEVSLKTVINDMVGIFDMLIKRKDFEQNKDVLLRVAIKENLLETNIITDKLRLEQILSNLISNAIKFTDHGYIEIGCTKLLNSEVLEFYIKDTGIGIKEEYQQFIFERFRKIEDDKSHLHRGAGLGLAICSQLVNLLGGSIYLKSEIEKGSVFYFTIPLVKPDSPNKSFLITKPSNKLPDFKNITILVAEDDISNYTYIAKLLKNAGANVIHAMNGRQVLELLKNTHDIKLILMDIKMPELDGVETLHEIQKMKINIPIIAQTAYALAEEVVKLKNEGFDEYISKPIEREHLYFLMEKCLNSNEKKLNT